MDEILGYLQVGSLDGTSEPLRVYLTCYQVLQANGDPRADDILEEGYRFLQERAAKISDEGERRSFLENVAANREIVGAWAARERRTNDGGGLDHEAALTTPGTKGTKDANEMSDRGLT